MNRFVIAIFALRDHDVIHDPAAIPFPHELILDLLFRFAMLNHHHPAGRSLFLDRNDLGLSFREVQQLKVLGRFREPQRFLLKLRGRARLQSRQILGLNAGCKRSHGPLRHQAGTAWQTSPQRGAGGGRSQQTFHG